MDFVFCHVDRAVGIDGRFRAVHGHLLARVTRTALGARDGTACGHSRGPRPLEVIPAKPPRDIDGLANEIEMRDQLRLHGFGADLIGRDTAERDLCGAVALG